MKRDSGMTLIELVIFIVILAILGLTILMSLGVSLEKSPSLQQNTQALEYAQVRMDLILGQKATKGFSSFVDPCAVSPSLAVCSSPGYTVASSIANNWNGNTTFKVITVTVTGDGRASLQGLVANY
jgi:type II secretory pathway pseudopilin PulG